MGLLTSGIAGAATGIVGTITTTVFGYFNDKQKNKQELELAKENNRHEAAMVDAKIRELEAEAKAQVQKIELEGDIARDIAAQESFNIALKAEGKSMLDSSSINRLLDGNKFMAIIGTILVFFMAIVDIVRSSMRPAITIVMMLITAGITVQYLNFLDVADTHGLVDKEIMLMVIDNIFYLTITSVVFWFGVRANEKMMSKGKRTK